MRLVLSISYCCVIYYIIIYTVKSSTQLQNSKK